MHVNIDEISFSYGNYDVLNNVSLDLEKGQILSIVGPNGSGKSTLLKCIVQILKQNNGEIYYEDTNIKEIDPKELAKKFGYVPQSSSQAFSFTVMDTVMLGRKPYIQWAVSKNDIEITSRVLKQMSLESISDRPLNELSGGQRQKVFIARAIAQETQTLLFDEPTNNLDIKHQLEVFDVVTDLSRKNNKTVIIVVHDLNYALRYSDKIIMLKDGQIYSAGKPEEVLTKENIKEVYDVEVEIIKNSLGAIIMPIKRC